MTAKDQQSYCMRPMRLDDIEPVSTWLEHLADLCLFDRSTPVPVNKSVMADGWKDVLTAPNPRRGYWFALDDSSGNIVGIAGIENINYTNGDGVLAVYLAEHARKKGLAVRASGLLLDLAFDQLRLNQITSYYREDNDVTQKLTGAIGFSREGLMRKAWFAGGKHFDIVVVGILGSEWAESRAKLAADLEGPTKLRFGRPPWSTRVWPEALT